MADDVKVNSKPLITNLDKHLQLLAAASAQQSQKRRDDGLPLLYSRNSDSTSASSADNGIVFVNIDQAPALRSLSTVPKTANVSLHPTANIPVPPRASGAHNGTDRPPANTTQPRFLPSSLSGSTPVRAIPNGRPSEFKGQVADNSRAMFTSKAVPASNSDINGFQDNVSFPSSKPVQPAAGPSEAYDDIVTYTQEAVPQAKRPAAMLSSQISSSYDSVGFDDIDSATQDPMQRIQQYSVASGASQVVSTRLSSSTSVSKGYDPYALVQRMPPSNPPKQLPNSPQYATAPIVPNPSTSPNPSTTEKIEMVDPHERTRLQSVVNMANLEFRKAKMFIENCTRPEDLDELEPRLQAASAALRAATQSLEAYDQRPPQQPMATNVGLASNPHFTPAVGTLARSGSNAFSTSPPSSLVRSSSPLVPPPSSVPIAPPQRHFDISLLEGLDEDDMEVIQPIPQSVSSFRPTVSTVDSNGTTRPHSPLWSSSERVGTAVGPRTSFGSLARTNSSVGAPSGGTLAPVGAYGSSFGNGFQTSTTKDTPTTNYGVPSATRAPAGNLNHLESGFTHNVSEVGSVRRPNVVEVVDEDEFDFEALDRLETAATSRAVVRSNLPSTSSECTSQFDPIPPTKGVTIEQYDPITSQQSKWHSQQFEWSSRINNVIQRTFGHQQWRTNQLEIVNAIMAKKNVFVTMPTGGGKSLCYQVPALASPGLTVVIQPLISLIEDQMMILHGLDIPCKFLCGKDYEGPWGTTDFDEIYGDILAIPPAIKILFITPERLTHGSFVLSKFGELARQELVSLFVVDECHCVSQWGHEFRPQYKELSKLKEYCPTVPVLALTATATIYVKVDILTVLRFFDNPRNVVCFTSSFNRPNLYFEVRPKTKTMKDEIAEFIHAHPKQSGIVYCLSRADCEEFSADMQARGFTCGFYHAHVSTKERAAIQSAWYNNELQFICATIAFGMGINKPDVRWVVHASIPKSLEGFYQEAGRAGRDGSPADCVVFSSGKDMMTWKRMALSSATHDPYRANDPVHANLMRLTQLAAFLEDRSVCRRTLVTQYFGERDASKGTNYNCGNCDTCLNSHNAMAIDVSSLTKSIITEYRIILKEPETVPRATKEKGKRAAAPKASHYQSQVASGTLRERCISNGSLSFLGHHGIKTKAELRSFFDYVFGKLVTNGIFIDVSSIGVLGRKGSASRMRFPPCHFMYELPQNSTALNTFERNGYKLSVVWKHPEKGARNVWAGADLDEDEDIVEELSPVPKRAKRSKSTGGTASDTPSSHTKATAAKKASSAKKSSSSLPASSNPSAKANGAKYAALATINSFPAFSRPLDDDLDLDDDYLVDDHAMDVDEPYDQDVDDYAMHIDLDQIGLQRAHSNSRSNNHSVPSSSTHTPSVPARNTSNTRSAPATATSAANRQVWNFVAPPKNGTAKDITPDIITVNDDIDDITDDPEIAALLRTPTGSQSNRPKATQKSPSAGRALIGRPSFATSSPSSNTKRYSVVDSFEDSSAAQHPYEDEDEIFSSFTRPSHRTTANQATGPVDPQRTLREKLVNELKDLRTKLGKEEKMVASGATQITSLFPDSLIYIIACEIPRNIPQFTSVNGIGEKRSEKYGARFVVVIEDFMELYPELKPLSDGKQIKL